MRLGPTIVACLLLAAVPGLAGKKKRQKAWAQGSPQEAVSKAIDVAGDKIRDCVTIEAIAKGVEAAEISITARLMVNSSGQLMGCQVTTNLPVATGGPLAKCVDKALRESDYPATSNPLINVDRTWKYRLK